MSTLFVHSLMLPKIPDFFFRFDIHGLLFWPLLSLTTQSHLLLLPCKLIKEQVVFICFLTGFCPNVIDFGFMCFYLILIFYFCRTYWSVLGIFLFVMAVNKICLQQIFFEVDKMGLAFLSNLIWWLSLTWLSFGDPHHLIA